MASGLAYTQSMLGVLVVYVSVSEMANNAACQSSNAEDGMLQDALLYVDADIDVAIAAASLPRAPSWSVSQPSLDSPSSSPSPSPSPSMPV